MGRYNAFGGIHLNILIFDADSKIENLAAMKLSAWHKRRKDKVGFISVEHKINKGIADPDRVYCCRVFNKSKDLFSGLKTMYPDAEFIVGGTGYDLHIKLPTEIELIKPDYDLYPGMTHSEGFTTRGCIRNCKEFCWVPIKEGKLVRAQHPQEWHDDRFKEIMVMDNNWLADKEWFLETSQWIIDKGLKVIEHGMDARLMDSERASQVKKLRKAGVIHIAWDYDKDEKAILNGIKAMQDARINTHSDVLCYVFCNGDEQYENALNRCRILLEHNTTPFLMVNPEGNITDRVKDLRWIVDRPGVVWAKDALKDPVRRIW